VLGYRLPLQDSAMADDHKPDNENPDLGWPKHDRTERPETGLFVSDTEMYRRLGVGPKTGRLAVQALEPHGFPLKQPLFGNKRYWPALRFFIDRYYGLIDGRVLQPAADRPRRPPAKLKLTAPKPRTP
jgi:hypothetical protein